MHYIIGIMGIFISTALYAINMDPASYPVKTNQNTVVIHLEANATTGYQWFVKNYDHGLLSLNGSQYLSPKKTIMGGPGTMIYSFIVNPHVARPKNTNIIFLYRRPWEPNTGTQKTVTLYFAQ